MAFEADVHRGVLSDRRHDVGARRARSAPAREAIDPWRGPRAPVLLRIGMGRDDRAAGVMAAVEDPSAVAHHRRSETHRVRRHSRVRWSSRAARTLAANETDRARRVGRLRLTRCIAFHCSNSALDLTNLGYTFDRGKLI